MTDLIARLQSLTKPNCEIDAEIAEAVHPWLRDCPRADGDDGPGWLTKDGRVYAPRYTESLDAVLTLKGDGFYLRHLDETPYGWTATIADKVTDKMWQETDAPTPAIALLIAIIKAKEESK